MCNRACGLRLIPEFTGCQADAKVLCSAGQRIPHKGVWRPLAHFLGCNCFSVSRQFWNKNKKKLILVCLVPTRWHFSWVFVTLHHSAVRLFNIERQHRHPSSESGANCLVLHLNPQTVVEIVTVPHSEWHHWCWSLLDTSTVLMSLIPKCCFLVVFGTPLGLGWGR